MVVCLDFFGGLLGYFWYICLYFFWYICLDYFGIFAWIFFVYLLGFFWYICLDFLVYLLGFFGIFAWAALPITFRSAGPAPDTDLDSQVPEVLGQ